MTDDAVVPIEETPDPPKLSEQVVDFACLIQAALESGEFTAAPLAVLAKQARDQAQETRSVIQRERAKGANEVTVRAVYLATYAMLLFLGASAYVRPSGNGKEGEAENAPTGPRVFTP